MKVMRVADSAPMPLLVADNIPEPRPAAGELLIRVHAAGVTPTELLWYPTSHSQTGGPRSRAVPAHEFSGTVAALGAGTEGFQAGQEVYGMNDWFWDGALAEYCITQPGWVAPKPARLTHVEAASVPIGALTAWQGLYERANLQAGECVLIHGGAGAVGVFAIQLARLRGAHVVATASARNLDFVSRLGADEVIDHRAARFEERVRDVDVVFDTVGGDTLDRSWSVLKPGGRLITIAAGSQQTGDGRIKQAFFIVEPSQQQLREMARLLEAGSLRPVVDAVLPLADASTAYAGQVSQRRGRGKLVVTVAG